MTPSLNEQDYMKMALANARKTATIFGVTAVIAMICGVYGYIQRERNAEIQKEIQTLKEQLVQCEAAKTK